MGELIEIPRCHYCDRFAPELHYKNISVCPQCLDNMGEWRAYRMPDGNMVITDDDPENLTDYEFIEAGTFTVLWAKMGESYDPNE